MEQIMLTPTLAQLRQQMKDHPAAPAVYSVLWDYATPVAVFDRLRREHQCCFLLESADHSSPGGRYSFLGFSPRLEITFRQHTAQVKSEEGTEEYTVENPMEFLRSLMKPYRTPTVPGLPKFTGGLIGYFGYDTVRYLEPTLTNVGEDDLQMPDCHLFLYDEIVAFDHFSNHLMLISNIRREEDVEQAYEQLRRKGEELVERISAPLNPQAPAYRGKMKITSNLNADAYQSMVEQAKEFILDGDIFQIVLSQRFEVENPPDSFEMYRRLRAENPSPYLYYFQHPDYCIAGASPEKLVSVENGIASTRPIAGTMPRGRTPQEDQQLEKDLLGDAKERSEHMMLVDLGRNDIGKVSRFGSVKVEQLMKIERYSQVMHLVSDVSGRLKPECDSLDALMAVIPAGTLSGAPKVRAMELIDSLEQYKRGVYGGTIGYLGFDGNLDTCICIRTALYRNGKAYVQAGAGIVADSSPEREYRETCNKAGAVLQAMEQAKELEQEVRV